MKLGITRSERLHPCRRARLHLLDELRDGDRARERAKDVDVIRLRVRFQRRTPEIHQHADRAGVKAFAVLIGDPAFPMFCAPDDMEQDVGERLRHGPKVRKIAAAGNPASHRTSAQRFALLARFGVCPC